KGPLLVCRGPVARRMVDAPKASLGQVRSIGLLAYERRNIDIFPTQRVRRAERPRNASLSGGGLRNHKWTRRFSHRRGLIEAGCNNSDLHLVSKPLVEDGAENDIRIGIGRVVNYGHRFVDFEQ